MRSTIYTIIGSLNERGTQDIKSKLTGVEGIGAIAFEVGDNNESRLFLKHKDDVTLNDAEVKKAVEAAGNYRLK